MRSLFEFYKQRVYGLDHPTLGVSPIENSLTLAQALPKNARVHLVTHSRGGLVAEVLARLCANPKLADDDFKLFDGAAYVPQRNALKALAAIVKESEAAMDWDVGASGTDLQPTFPSCCDFRGAWYYRRMPKRKKAAAAPAQHARVQDVPPVSSLRVLVGAVLIAAITILAYRPALTGGLIFDDDQQQQQRQDGHRSLAQHGQPECHGAQPIPAAWCAAP